MSEGLRSEIDGAVGRLTFDRPEKHNAMSRAMWEALPGALDALASREGVRVIVLSGAGGRAFVSGADISEFDAMRAGADAVAAYDAASHAAFDALAACPLPTIAMIRGICFGGGVAIASCCALRYASLESRFSIPAARLGLGYPAASLARLVALTGPAHAREIFYTARRYDGAEAERIGLVNRALPDAALEGHVAEIADQIATAAPLTVRAARLGIDALSTGGDLAACAAAVRDSFASEDYAEGRRAFAEKRAPKFKGV